jgi:hypothetical protein
MLEFLCRMVRFRALSQSSGWRPVYLDASVRLTSHYSKSFRPSLNIFKAKICREATRIFRTHVRDKPSQKRIRNNLGMLQSTAHHQRQRHQNDISLSLHICINVCFVWCDICPVLIFIMCATRREKYLSFSRLTHIQYGWNRHKRKATSVYWPSKIAQILHTYLANTVVLEIRSTNSRKKWLSDFISNRDSKTITSNECVR